MANRYNLEGHKIFITGGAGFIATRIAHELVDDNQIVLYDNLHNDALSNTTLANHPNVHFIKGDILDLNTLEEVLPNDTDYIIHCAAIAGVDTVLKYPMKTLEVNIQGVFNICRAANKLKNLKRLVDFSTSEVFGKHAYDVDESIIHPAVSVNESRWTYSISKLAGEFIAHGYHVQEGMPTVTVRPFNIYGPNQVGVGAIHNFVLRALNNDPITVHDDGAQIRSWCYVDDFIHGVILSMLSDVAVGKSYNIGSPRATVTVYHLAQMIKAAAKSDSVIEFKKVDYEDVKIRIPNITAAREDLGFEPLVEMEEGIERTVAWYRKKLNQ